MAGKPHPKASRLLVAVLSGALALSLGQAMEQSGGIVRGRVLDATRAPIAGARITTLPGDGRATGPSAVSDQIGEFSLTLDLGFYTVKVAAQGFLDIRQTVLLREPGSESRDFVLQVAGIHETVTVSESCARGPMDRREN